MAETCNLSGLILAAGLSTRYGLKNKLLADFGGISVIRNVTQMALNSGLSSSIVVTGHQSQSIAKELHNEKVRIVYNPAYAKGMGASISFGISCFSKETDGVLIILGDMPKVASRTIRILCEAFKNNKNKDIFVPTFNGKQGNPVLFGSTHFSALRKLSGDRGGLQIIEKNLHRSKYISTSDSGILIDYDEPY